MMWGHGYGVAAAWMWVWGLLWLVLIGVVIVAVVRALRQRMPTSWPSAGPSAMEILRQRYARGEIDAATFDQMRAQLLAAGARDTASMAAGTKRGHRPRWPLLVVVLLLVLLGAILTAMSWWPYGMMGPYYGPGSTMGPYFGTGEHSDYPYGPGGMMGGYYRQGPVPQGTPAVDVTQVTIEDYAYQPDIIQVTAGTTVTWTNQDSVPHTVTFQNGMKDSGLILQGHSFTYTFTASGTYDYFCTLYPYMVGRVIVTS